MPRLEAILATRTIDEWMALFKAADVPAAPVNKLGPPSTPGAPIAPVDATSWSRLAVFAQRTFAPATEASRLSGAGAGLSDNN